MAFWTFTLFPITVTVRLLESSALNKKFYIKLRYNLLQTYFLGVLNSSIPQIATIAREFAPWKMKR